MGKTTTAVNLAASLAALGRRTLLLDLDPQGNASSALSGQGASPQIYDALLGDSPMAQIILDTALPLLDLAPAGPDLVGAEIELVGLESREGCLRRAVEPVLQRYEFVLIDCPPSLGLLTINALTAADSLLIPLQCEYYALEGLARLLDTLSRVRQGLNPGLAFEGIVFTMFDPRATLSRQVAEQARQHFGERVYRTEIPRNIRLSEAPSHGKPVLLYDKHSKGARAYSHLAEELLERRRAQAYPRFVPRSEGTGLNGSGERDGDTT